MVKNKGFMVVFPVFKTNIQCVESAICKFVPLVQTQVIILTQQFKFKKQVFMKRRFIKLAVILLAFASINSLYAQRGKHPATGKKYYEIKPVLSPSGKTYYLAKKKKNYMYALLNSQGNQTVYPMFYDATGTMPTFEWGKIKGREVIKTASSANYIINFIDLESSVAYEFVLLFKNPSSDGFLVIRDQADERWCSLGIIRVKDWNTIHTPGRNYLFMANRVGNERFKLFGIDGYGGICSFGIKDNWTLLDKNGNYFMADKIYNKDGQFVENSTKENYVASFTLEVQPTEIPFELQQKIMGLQFSNDVDGFLATFKQQYSQYTISYRIDALRVINSMTPAGTYTGQLYSGKPCGIGAWISDDKKFIYTGAWKDGGFSGKGHFRQSGSELSNYSLSGNFSNGLPADKEMVVISPKIEQEENTMRDVIFYALAGSRRTYKFSLSSWTEVGEKLIDHYSAVKSRNDEYEAYESKQKEEIEYIEPPKLQDLSGWKEEFSAMDGKYFTQDVEYSDGVSGQVCKGGNSSDYFIEDGFGHNNYYVDYNSAIRALYVYKKFDKFIQRGRK